MTATAKKAPTYRVTWPMIQILGHIPFDGTHRIYDKHLRLGDIVPDWVPSDEVQRLLDQGCIEVIS